MNINKMNSEMANLDEIYEGDWHKIAWGLQGPEEDEFGNMCDDHCIDFIDQTLTFSEQDKIVELAFDRMQNELDENAYFNSPSMI